VGKELLLEIGAEELPASFIEPALEDLRRSLTEGLARGRLGHGAVRLFGTPRRLAVAVAAVAERSEDLAREVLGPPVRAAFDAQGKPTRAAEKFAEGVGRPVPELRRIATSKGEYLGATVNEAGRPAAEILKEVLHAAVHGIAFRKSMRWGDVELAFARPVHWLVALHGEEIVPVVLGDVASGRTTRGHRFLAPQPITLSGAGEYEPAMERAQVIADPSRRKAVLLERLSAAAAEAGGMLLDDPALVDQVNNLVEQPSPVVGSFDPRHLDLPPEVLVQEMKSHQRYFSLTDAAGKLLPRFIAVSNTPVRDPALSLRGYERVLRARLSDGRFFFDEDRKLPLAARVEKLARVVWQGKLGSYAEKVGRIEALAAFLVARTGRTAEAATVQRAAHLCKADLVTSMVGEFPELQGVMGREYARADGEPPAVAQAIHDHYLPRGAADALPGSDAGALVGLADRFDSLCGIFALGKIPTGAADPFALRRACLAIINITLARGYRLSLAAVIDQALRLLAPKLADVKRKPGEPPVREQVLDFFRARLKAQWTEAHRTDVVEAVLAAGFDDLVAARGRLQALSALVARPDFTPLAVAFKRVANIVEKQGQDVAAGPALPDRFTDAAEHTLHAAFTRAAAQVATLIASDDYASALEEITALKPAVDAYFDQVMVMAEDRALRENRVRLLVEIGTLFARIADFTRIQAELG
jgi:glycyl-tRNA synthetase beta chain